MGIGDWGFGPIPNPQSPIPIPNPQFYNGYFSDLINFKYIFYIKTK